MAADKLLKIRCRRCGREIFTTILPDIIRKPSYKRFGGICNSCLTDEEGESLSREQIREIAQSARRYAIVNRIDWEALELSEPEGRILRFIAARVFYTRTLPSGGDISAEFGDMETEEYLARLEHRGIIRALF